MRRSIFFINLCLCALTLAYAAPLLAADGDRILRHLSETPDYRAALPGEWMTTWYALWAPRYITVTKTSSFDDAFARKWFSGTQWVAPRVEAAFDYRLDNDWTLGVRPELGLSYGFTSFSDNEKFRFSTIDGRAEMPARFAASMVSLDFGARAGARYDDYEALFEWRELYAWRFQRVRASGRALYSSTTGLIDYIASPVRNETELLTQHSPALGFGYHFGNAPWNYSANLLVRPATYVDFKDAHTYMTGMTFELAADGLRLTNDVALALGVRWDFWFPNDNLNNMHYFEFCVGIRFS